jgi:hypothetical protein
VDISLIANTYVLKVNGLPPKVSFSIPIKYFANY